MNAMYVTFHGDEDQIKDLMEGLRLYLEERSHTLGDVGFTIAFSRQTF